MKRARIIYNPTSGREVIKREMLDILAVYEQAGYETSAFATTPDPLSAAKEAERAAKEGFDLIVAAGGDGTINEVVNGVAPLRKRPMIAIIPAGTTNDYARALKIPRDEPLEAAKVIFKNENIKMDIGKVNNQTGTKYFMNIAALGTISEVTYSVPSIMKSLYGYLAYLIKGTELIARVKNVNARVSYDGGEYSGSISMIFLALTNSVGGFESIVPDAKLDDGKFTLLIVKTANIFQIMELVAQTLNGGRHIDNENLIYKKTNKVEITPLSDEQLKVNLDGEYGGDAPMSFKNLRQHIRFVANRSAMSVRAIEENAKQQFVEEVEKLEAQEQKED
ncbi:diacylglycerol kinase family lipid kinase [Convivina intestini]|uniref:Diacylglycerol kinase (ATP) n=1 Tax=Convivina intestini TaxID=1505726 RepID=A0A2U1DCH1_9LACO|nr:diacylglycerol kinase family lipid kinase [Convivina intestini]PVY85279.1 diacylglycerol kinase (ATP) [Convivina intestini]CAH1852727.1 Diacylglycerol kinase [Convivina intestini]SDB86809.1 diacylglycerol kinase (ATP) [Leuconostocaceae bacterium R-53105]